MRSPQNVLTTISSKRRIGDDWRIVQNVLSNRLEMLFYLARSCRSDILWSVKTGRREQSQDGRQLVTDAGLGGFPTFTARVTTSRKVLLSCGKYCTAMQIGIVPGFQILLGILKTRNRLRRGVLCIFVGRTFVPISWMCKKQTSVSHSSTESDVISLYSGFRTDGILALDLWDLVIEGLSKAEVRR